MVRHLEGVFASLAGIGVVEQILRCAIPTQPKQRWFCLHALINFAVAAFAVPDMVRCVEDPKSAVAGKMTSHIPSYLSFSVHLFHLIEGALSEAGIRNQDLFHHVVFVGIFGAVNFALEWGPIVNALLFFITGVPGGIVYTMLVLVKRNRMDSLTQKLCNKWIDLLIRGPGLVAVSACMVWNATQGRNGSVPALAVFGSAALASFNGTYYTREAVRNYHRTATQRRYVRKGFRPLTRADLKRCVDERLSVCDDFSVGCFVVSATSRKVLLIRPILGGKSAKYWVFPKGHPDDTDVDEVAAAVRETFEETGVKPDSVDRDIFTDIQYSFVKRMHGDAWKRHADYPNTKRRPNLCFHKTVRLYLARVDAEESHKLAKATTESAEIAWVSYENVETRLHHEEDKRVARFFFARLGWRAAAAHHAE